MPKTALAGLAAIIIAGSSLAHAQSSPTIGRGQETLSEADLKAFTDRRIDLVKTALQLTPEQRKYWPAVEEAIRERSATRQRRLAALADRLQEQREQSPIELMRARADALGQKAAALRKLGDAWQPLYTTLDADQKLRLRLLAVYVVREMRDAIESRRMQLEDDYGDDE
jgi:zinc resistance-associated protein